MKQSDLKPASTFANHFGVKALIYGAPGSGKTPIMNTAPRPVLLACEPGLLSMRNSNVPTWLGFTPEAIDEFFQWLFNSNEAKNFDTVGIDSTSQMADIYLQTALRGKSNSGNQRHGQAAYGEMARRTMEHLRTLFFTQYKHTYLICKEFVRENGMRFPYFPGQQLLTDVPHMYDEILHLGIQNVPQVGQVKAFRCWQATDVLARDRTGRLNEFEQPDFNAIVAKAMS